jgi:hypothetical protein
MAETVGWTRRVIAVGAMALAAMGAAATGVMWRADAAAQAGEYAIAARWRPGVALYRREWGESLLLRAPQRALEQLRIAARLDPRDPLTQADLTTAELATGAAAAAAAAAEAQARGPGFGAAWRLANLDLARGDRAGFWRQTRRAAGRAQPGDFAPLESRALTATDYDFAALRRALPAHSAPAASTLLQQALADHNAAAARSAAAWLLGLRPAAAEREQRRLALLAWVAAAWRQWPAQAAGVEHAVAAAGLLPLGAKRARAPYLSDGNFNPLREAAITRVAPDANSGLRAIVGWRWPGAAGVRFYQVLTADPAHPSAAEFGFDGDEPDDVPLAQQWLLARPGATLTLRAWTRALGGASGGGLSVRLTTLQGAVLGEIPLPLGASWRLTQGTLRTPAASTSAAGAEAYALELHYRRPNGELPLHLDALVSGVELR